MRFLRPIRQRLTRFLSNFDGRGYRELWESETASTFDLREMNRELRLQLSEQQQREQRRIEFLQTLEAQRDRNSEAIALNLKWQDFFNAWCNYVERYAPENMRYQMGTNQALFHMFSQSMSAEAAGLSESRISNIANGRGGST